MGAYRIFVTIADDTSEQCIGVLKVLAEVAKLGPIELLQQHIARCYEICGLISRIDSVMANTVIRRMRIKLLSRLATRVLPARRGQSSAFRGKLRLIQALV